MTTYFEPSDLSGVVSRFSRAALENIEETGVDPLADAADLRSGAHTSESLLAQCLRGADDDRAEGWHDYVSALAAEVTS